MAAYVTTNREKAAWPGESMERGHPAWEGEGNRQKDKCCRQNGKLLTKRSKAQPGAAPLSPVRGVPKTRHATLPNRASASGRKGREKVGQGEVMYIYGRYVYTRDGSKYLYPSSSSRRVESESPFKSRAKGQDRSSWIPLVLR